MKNRKKQYMIVIIIFICLIFLIMHFTIYDFLQEDVIFFQFFNSKNQSKDISNINQSQIKEDRNQEEASINIKSISFNVQFQNTKLKALDLMKTIDEKTLVYEKIAPGTSGRFDIILHANQNMNYQIQFESKNEKPSNLFFYSTEEEKIYYTLEELGENLTGKLLKNEEKTIPIYWKWKYETDENQDEQDTLEARKIREYHFLIYVQGY